MNFTWIFLYACLIECSISVLENEHRQTHENKDREISADFNSGPQKLMDISLPKPTSDPSSAIKLLDLVQEKGSSSIKDHFGAKLISSIQGVITNLLSNPQAISFLLTLIPTFPPAAIIGSFVMVVLSILQNPTVLQLFQNILPDLKFLTDNFKDTTIPKYLKDFDDIDKDNLDFVEESAKYGTKLVDIASKELHLKDLNSHELDSLKHRLPGKKIRSLSKTVKEHKNGRYQKNNDENSIPLSKLQ